MGSILCRTALTEILEQMASPIATDRAAGGEAAARLVRQPGRGWARILERGRPEREPELSLPELARLMPELFTDWELAFTRDVCAQHRIGRRHLEILAEIARKVR